MRPDTWQRVMRGLVFLVVLVFFSGCLPIPHTSQRSPEFRGTVLDARTQTPVQGAKIFLSEDPAISCTSDGSGSFRLRATRNFHLLYLWNPAHETMPDDWPKGKTYWIDSVTISHPNYGTKRAASTYTLPERGIILFEGNILLEPKK
jgi:hypothetical protein